MLETRWRFIRHDSQNLQRAAEQVQNFKQIAVDQSTEERRSFLVRSYIEDTIFSLQPPLRRARHSVEVFGDEQLSLYSYPGALAQIISSFIMNSVMHAYPDGKQGRRLRVSFERNDEKMRLNYSDDGCGIPKESLKKIFEPFFTTARAKGGSGLGLHIVYNIVTRQLQGRISCESESGRGTRFIIDIPLEPKELKSLE